MISLSRHIEILLLEHDCVIIPGLGGFIANQASARYNDDNDNLFLPPFRSIGFNKELTVNDGLLVQSYMQAYDAAYPEAYLQMEKDVDQLLATLESEGEYTLNGIGTLTKNINGGITFSAFESGVLTPELYGLYSIEIKSLEDVKKEQQILQAISQTSILPIQTETDIVSKKDNPASDTLSHRKNDKPGKESKDVVIRLHKRWVELGVAAAVAVLFFFLFTYPSLKSDKQLNDTLVASAISINPATIQGTPAKHTATTVSYAAKKDNTAKAQPATKNNESKAGGTEKDSKNQNIQNKNNGYVIVLASCVSARNAQLFIDNLEKEGFREARFVKGEKNRILYSSYPSEGAAYSALQDLRTQSPSFESAWVLCMN